MKISKILAICVGTVAILAASGYWYVFVAGAPQLDPPQVERKTGLKFELKTFNSAAIGGVRTYGLILPPRYAQNPTKRYPVIFLLHGGHGDARAWEDKAAVTSVLHDLYRENQLPASIVITPDGNDRRGTSPLWDSQYYDGPNGKVGTLIGSELVQVVKSRYRTLNQPQFWAMGGQSSGGWGDREFLTSTQQFHQTLNRLGIANEFRVFPGGHGIVGANSGWNYWHKHLADALIYVGVQFKRAEG